MGGKTSDNDNSNKYKLKNDFRLVKYTTEEKWSRCQIKWQPQWLDCIRLMWMFPYMKTAYRSRLGMVLRNDKGKCISSMNKCLEGKVSILEAEATKVYEPLYWIKTLGSRKIRVECDSLNAVNASIKSNRFIVVGVFYDKERN